MTPVEQERIAHFIKVNNELIKAKDGDDFIKDTITAGMTAFVYTASKEVGEFTVHVKRPTFLDWLLRRDRTIVIPYTIRQLMKKERMPDTLATIEIKQ